MIKTKLIRKKGGTQHVAGGNRYTGGIQSTDYAAEAGHAREADQARNAEAAVRSQYSEKSGHADSAADIDASSSIWDKLKGLFISKIDDDTASGLITFLKGLVSKAKAVFMDDVKMDKNLDVKGNLSVGSDGNYGIDKDGVATLAKVVADYMQSPDLVRSQSMGFDGHGFGITKGSDGKYTFEVDNFIARMKMIVAQLEVHTMSFIGGDVVMSKCGNRMSRIEALDKDGNVIATSDLANPTLTIPSGKAAASFRCYFLASDGDYSVKNEWAVGQLARCKTNNLSTGTYTDYENRDYWRLVVGVSSSPVTKDGKSCHYIDLSNNPDTGISLTDLNGTTHIVDKIPGVSATLNSLPHAGDDIVGMGHNWDTARQDVAYFSASGWTLYKGIDHYDLPEERIVNKFGIDKSIVATDHLILRPYAQPTDTSVALCDRGVYSEKSKYGYGDLVSYKGQLWKCVVKLGDTVMGEAPSAASSKWVLYVAKGEQGAQGAQGPKGETGAQGPKGETGAQGDGYTVSFLLNGVPIDSLNFDDVKASESATLEADFYNNGVSANAASASVTCYDQDGNVLGSPVTSSNTDNVVVDGGNLYLSKDCKYITVVAKDKDGKLLVSKSIGIVRNGKDGTDATELISLMLYLTEGAYTWRTGQGKIATIAAAVTKGSYDITDAQDASQFIWTRESSNSQGDSDWNSQHKFGAKTLTVSEGDMCGDMTTFVCTLHKATGEVYTMAKQDFTI